MWTVNSQFLETFDLTKSDIVLSGVYVPSAIESTIEFEDYWFKDIDIMAI